MRSISSAFIAIALCMAPAAAVSSQDSQSNDWELINTNRGNTVAAAAQFDNGITLIARCQNRQAFDLLIGGLPDSSAKRRTLQVGVGENSRMRNVEWLSGADRKSAFSLYPMSLARDLMRGGTIRIRVPGQNGAPSTLYVMETEPSVTAIAETLTACDKPLVDPRDARETEMLEELPADIEWARRPMPSPDAIGNAATHLETYVVVSCLTAEGGALKDCRIESANPFNERINRIVLDASRNGRLRLKVSGEAPLPDREISYAVPIFIS